MGCNNLGLMYANAAGVENKYFDGNLNSILSLCRGCTTSTRIAYAISVEHDRHPRATRAPRAPDDGLVRQTRETQSDPATTEDPDTHPTATHRPDGTRSKHRTAH